MIKLSLRHDSAKIFYQIRFLHSRYLYGCTTWHAQGRGLPVILRKSAEVGAVDPEVAPAPHVMLIGAFALKRGLEGCRPLRTAGLGPTHSQPFLQPSKARQETCGANNGAL